jgi:hypothetical protein
MGDIFVAVGAYVASIYTWPWLRTKLVGIEAEVKALEARAQALKTAVTGK